MHTSELDQLIHQIFTTEKTNDLINTPALKGSIIQRPAMPHDIMPCSSCLVKIPAYKANLKVRRVLDSGRCTLVKPSNVTFVMKVCF